MPKVIVLEFNELCPSLLERWMNEGRLPNFAALLGQCHQFTTEPDVTDPGKLEPWIQWYSVHTGLAYHQHRVFHLTDGARAGHPDIFSTLIDAGRRVGCFASMNVAPFAAPGSFFVGDPWTENNDAYPAKLNIYNRFISRNVREYSNASDRMGLADYTRFLAFMAANGLRASTVSRIMSQLATEQLQDRRLSYRRVALLDRLQFDVFRSCYERYRPDLATFFINSTAHLQHSYWRHMDPAPFSIRPDEDELRIYGDAVRFGYEAMDALVGEFMTLARRHHARLVFMTALSQQPFLRREERGGQHFHRLHNVGDFLKALDIEVEEVDPTMTHQYLARFSDRHARDAARERLGALLLEGRQVFGFANADASDNSLYFGCQIFAPAPSNAAILDAATGTTLAFSSLFYRIEAIKSGCHHPSGALWIEAGEHRAHAIPASILDLFPTVLDLLDVAVPPQSHRHGRSLKPLLEPAEPVVAAELVDA